MEDEVATAVTTGVAQVFDLHALKRLDYIGVTNRVKGAAAGFAMRPLALE